MNDEPDTTTSGYCGASDASTDPRVERTRHAVITAGIPILLENGPDGVTHAAIATAARVSRTTLYKYWPTRAELLFDILNNVKPRTRPELSGDIRTDLLHKANEMAEAFADPRLTKVFSALITQAQWDDETNHAQEALIEAGLADMQTVLEAAVENGQLSERIEPIHAVSRLVGPMFFAALIARRPMDADDVERLVDDWLASIRP
ncbi:MAG: TetR/AcrR family transcriptional regulator [Ilumatobacter sp.]|uniref:TetR/AcrR family transcriptional regulator n=1 Tax=Ilumatobacter sp. TaxID=1967498 RepID=UPI00391A51B3